MNKIILQPAGDSDASQHYVDTIENPVEIDIIRKFVSEDEYNKLENLYKDGRVPVWGVTPAADGSNYRKWLRINSGDVTLFSRKGRIFASAVVTFKIHNRDLALNLWERNEKGETWECIYFLDELKKQNISYAEFNKVAGYDTDNVIQRFDVLYEPKSKLIFNAFDLESRIPPAPEPPIEEYENVINKLKDLKSNDAEIKALRRIEQGYLRSQLFEGKEYFECGICNNKYPVSFLVAAHIKKRSECTLEEQKDKSIVMPMCKFGCDELYENGYISVKEGSVIQIKEEPMTPLIQDYIDIIEGKNCKYWNKSTSKYFNWHSEDSKKEGMGL